MNNFELEKEEHTRDFLISFFEKIKEFEFISIFSFKKFNNLKINIFDISAYLSYENKEMYEFKILIHCLDGIVWIDLLTNKDRVEAVLLSL